MATTKKYKVILPIDVDGRVYPHGQTVELDDETATAYSHALLPANEEEEQE